MKRMVILKSNYVIAITQWDGISPWYYPEDHDSIIEDLEEISCVGDWYEASEGIFYHPSKTPPDFPINS